MRPALITMARQIATDHRARKGEIHLFVFNGGAIARAVHIGNEDIWKGVESIGPRRRLG